MTTRTNTDTTPRAWIGCLVADRACRYRRSGELVPRFRRPGTGPCVRRAGTVGAYSQ